ncbi:hypothetical protein ACLB2K_051961 [Fragaria x ananassa]
MAIPAKKKSRRINTMLNDDVLGLILHKIKCRKDKESFSEVCKQWLRVRHLNRKSLRVLESIPLRELTRFPNLVDFGTWMLTARRKKKNKQAWYYPRGDTRLKLIAKACPDLKTLMVCCDDKEQVHDDGLLGPKGLHALANGCPKLSMLLFCGRKVVGNPAVDALCHSAHNLKALCLRNIKLISDQALRAIGSSSISTLELVSCDNVTDVGLGFLATSKTLKKLVIDGCRKITETGLVLLRNMCSLEHLALSWSRLTDAGVMAISEIRTLKELRLSPIDMLDLSDRTMVALAENCSRLETLDLHSCRVTGAGIRAFSGHKCLKFLSVMYSSSVNFDQSDVERLALGCPSLKCVVLHESLERSFESMHENAKSIMKFVYFSNILPPFSTGFWSTSP